MKVQVRVVSVIKRQLNWSPMSRLLFLSVLCAPVLVTNSQAVEFANGVKVEAPKRGISAVVLDKGDHYILGNGKKVKLYQKQGAYVVHSNSNTKRAVDRFKAQFGDRVSQVSGNKFATAAIIRVENNSRAKGVAKQSFDIDRAMLKGLDSSITRVDPVFTSASGNDDLLVLPKIKFRLNSDEALQSVLKQYSLNPNQLVNLSNQTHSVGFLDSQLPADKIFEVARLLASDFRVVWAEPQFHFKPIKAQFTPNDPLFDKQWHLQDQGYRGSRCDTDCDADEAWDIGNVNGVGSVSGDGTVIAVIDDGVQLNHPDLLANLDTANDFDFVDDSTAVTCPNNGLTINDGQSGRDSNASPHLTANCILNPGDPALDEDNHGTALAGIAAAVSNTVGVTGVAFNAEILPVRAISDFVAVSTDVCVDLAAALRYSAQYADVILAGWQLPLPCQDVTDAITEATIGTVTDGDGSKRDGMGGVGLGSPVIAASGNDATGWVKITVPVTAGLHAYEWRQLRSDFSSPNDAVDETVWLDEITWSDGSVEGFEQISNINSSSNDFTTASVFDSCMGGDCDTPFPTTQPLWSIETDAVHVHEGSRSARIVSAGTESDCANSYLHIIKDGPAGSISFWVWVSIDAAAGGDKFEFLRDGKEIISYGDIRAFFTLNNNDVGFPANLSSSLPGLIAVGASSNGDLSGASGISTSSEQRAHYSQFGPELDVVAPSSNQHVGVTTTDRTGADGVNVSSSADLSDLNYTQLFQGTSASAAIVSGIATTIIATDNSLNADEVKDIIRDTADKIGNVDYDNDGIGRNDFHGSGRVNMFRALTVASGSTDPGDPTTGSDCSADSFDFSIASDLFRFQIIPQALEFCSARGPLVPDDSFCVPITSVNGNVAVICL